jgi:hypothetical protein
MGDWSDLAKQVTKETDRKKLIVLVGKLCQALDTKQPKPGAVGKFATQEHDLICAMLTAQYELSMTIFEILKSRGLASEDDLKPFFELAHGSSTAQRFRVFYRQKAEEIGLRIA